MLDLHSFHSQLDQLEVDVKQSESRVSGTRRVERDKRTVKGKLPMFNQLLAELDQALDTFAKHPKQYGFRKSDASSLISRINSLRSKLEALEKICSKEPDSRSALLGSAGMASSMHYQDTEETAEMTNQELFSQHIDRQTQHDAQLDTITRHLDNLLEVETEQNKKLTHHNQVINTIHDKMDQTDEDLNTNVKHTDIIAEHTAGGWISLIVSILLFVAIILALFTNALCPMCIGGNGKHC